MAFPDDLLEQAQHLAKRETKRPRQASLRRAISAAYYSLFQLLIAEAVSNWRISAQRPRLARIFEHGRMNTASLRVANAPLAGAEPTMANHPRNVGRAFNQLYEQRQTADYDTSKSWSRTEVLAHINRVERAFASWKAIRGQGIANEFLLSLLVRDRQ